MATVEHLKICSSKASKSFAHLSLKLQRRKNRFLNQTIPLFPGYLFMGSNIEPITWGSVNATRGIKGCNIRWKISASE